MNAITFTEAERNVFARRPKITGSDWACKNVIVQDGPFRGSPLRLEVAPFLKTPLDAYADPSIEEIVFCGSLQIGKTLFLYSCLGYSIDYRDGTRILSMPTKSAMERVRDEKLVPLLKGSPALHRRVHKYKADVIEFKDGTNLWLCSAESPSLRASITAPDILLDEEDLYAAAGNSRAVEDFKGRARSHPHDKKIVRVCQPKGGEESSIWQGITRQVDLLYCFEVKCPACGQSHLPNVANIRVQGDETDPLVIRREQLARYHCPGCNWAWSDHIRDLAVRAGEWKPYAYTPELCFEPCQGVAEPRSVGFHAPAILSRMVSLSDLAARRIEAEQSDDPEIKRQYHNDDLALPFTPVKLETSKDKILALREAWLPARQVPFGAVALTCTVDVQKRGFWYLTRAWMPSLASYVIDSGYLLTWEDVRKLYFETYYPVMGPNREPAGETGELMPIWRGLIDSGGTETDGVFTRTEEVYLFVREFGQGVVFAAKGASTDILPVVKWRVLERMPHNGKPIPGGIHLYRTNTGYFKTLEFSRMFNPESQQPLRFHRDFPEEHAAQLASEQLVREGNKEVWKKSSEENHLFDCLHLSGACADASFTPSLPFFIMQAKAAEAAANNPGRARPEAKKRKPRPERQNSRWG